MDTSQYTFVQMSSGAVWGSAWGKTPADAARALDRDIDGPFADEHRYEESNHADGANYAVHPGGIPEDTDPHDRAFFDELDRRGLVCYVRCTPLPGSDWAGDEA